MAFKARLDSIKELVRGRVGREEGRRRDEDGRRRDEEASELSILSRVSQLPAQEDMRWD
jgi:hypothetical protein